MNANQPTKSFTRSLETLRSTDKGWRVAGMDWKTEQPTETEHFEKFFATREEALQFQTDFIGGTHKR